MTSADKIATPLSPARRWGFWSGLVLAGLVLVLPEMDPARPEVSHAAAIAVLMAVWWITEALPLAATALLPVVAFPLLGVLPGREVAPQYFNDTIFLFVGGFMIAIAMERWNLHERLALGVLGRAGSRPRSVLAAFMVATAFLSMWVSNTATAMMMVPIAVAVVMKMTGEGSRSAFGAAVLLGVAYAASIGGIATLVGTPPNLAFDRIFQIQFPEREAVTFAQWMLFGLPLSVVMLGIAFAWLGHLAARDGAGLRVDPTVIAERRAGIGRITRPERRVAIVFGATALLWITRSPLDLGGITLPGWSQLLPWGGMISDGTVAMTMALLLFILPSGTGGDTRLLNADSIRRLPWGIVLLFGGGFALAAGVKESGLSEWIGLRLEGAGALPPALLIALVCLVITFMTELTSNTASANILLPLLASLGVATGMDPMILMIAGTVSCSCAFMLPVATPPNAIVFGSERIEMKDMVRAGIVLNLAGVVIVTLFVLFWLPLVFK